MLRINAPLSLVIKNHRRFDTSAPLFAQLSLSLFVKVNATYLDRFSYNLALAYIDQPLGANRDLPKLPTSVVQPGTTGSVVSTSIPYRGPMRFNMEIHQRDRCLYTRNEQSLFCAGTFPSYQRQTVSGCVLLSLHLTTLIKDHRI